MPEQPKRMRRNRKKLEHIHQRVRDANGERTFYEGFWDRNLRMSLGSHEISTKAFPDVSESTNPLNASDGLNPERGRREYFFADKINEVLVTQWAVQTEAPPKIIYRPVETNEPSEYYLKPEAMEAVGLLPPDMNPLSQEQLAGMAPISEAQYEYLITLPDPTAPPPPAPPPADGPEGEAQTQPPPQAPPIATPDDFIEVNDAVCADALSQEVASQWRLANGELEVSQNIYANLVIGHCDMMVEWDDEQHRIRIQNLYPYNVWIDPWATNFANAEYYVIRQVRPLAEAQSDYPHIRKQLEEQKIHAGETSLEGTARGYKYDAAQERPVIEEWNLFERYAQVPMDEEEALEAGLVAPMVEAQPNPENPAEVVEVVARDEDGEPVYQIVGAEGEDGEPTPVQPGESGWPTKTGIRQLSMVGDYVIYDGPSSFLDIPIGRNVNIPVVESPYGQGEPQRLRDLQVLRNHLVTMAGRHARSYAQQQQVMPLSVAEALEEYSDQLYQDSDARIGVPDELYDQFGEKLVYALDMPAMPDGFNRLIGFVDAAMDRIGGQTAVLRGEAKSEWSGDLFEAATAAAKGPIGAKARAATYMLRYLGRIIAHLVLEYMPEDEWVRRNKKYPPAVLRAMRRRLRSFGFDVEADVSGAGNKELKAQRLTTALSNTPNLSQSPTFMRQYLDMMGVPEADKISGEITMPTMPPPTP